MLRDLIEDWGKPILAFILLTFCGLLLAASLAWLSGPAEASPTRLTIAKKYIGMKEGTKSANRSMGVNTRRTPWCGYFVRKIVSRAGQTPVRGYPSAAAWKRFGRGVKLSQARKGDIVVIRTKRGNHVTIFSHRSKGRVCGVGGNQSNRVKVSCYSARSVRSVRR